MSSRWPAPDLPPGADEVEDFLPEEKDDGELWWGGHEDEYDYTTYT